MIIFNSADRKYAIFHPEDGGERKTLACFPGLLREAGLFFCPSKHHIVYNLFTRLQRKIKVIKVTKELEKYTSGDIAIKELPETFKFHTTPLKHQVIALRFAYTFGNFLNLSEPGLGKTKVTLDFIKLMGFAKSIIVCPKPLLDVWPAEAKKHRPELSVYVVKSSNWDKEYPGILEADVTVVNYDKAVGMEKNLIGMGFNFIAVDEGLIKNPATERTKSLTKLSKTIESKCVMSGTLVNNSPLDVFAPVRFVEPSLVGESFSRFRDEYVIASQRNRFVVLGYRYIPEIKDILGACGIIMTKAEWLTSLPNKIFNKIYATMGDQQREYYQKLASNYLLNIESIGQEIEVDNPLSVMIKLNQISNGFVYYKEDEAESLDEMYGVQQVRKIKESRKTYFFEEQPKAKALVDLIKSKAFNTHSGSYGSGTRAIVWFNLSAELEIIERHFKKEGFSYIVIKGGEKNVSQKVNEFNCNSSLQFIVCQAKTLNYGVTVLGDSETDWDLESVPEFDPLVSDEIFYSINFSLEMFLQQQDRIHRIGQVRECRYWLILSNSKVERTVANRLESKLLCNKDVLVDIINSIDAEKLIV